MTKAENLIRHLEATADLVTDPHHKAYILETAARFRAHPETAVIEDEVVIDPIAKAEVDKLFRQAMSGDAKAALAYLERLTRRANAGGYGTI